MSDEELKRLREQAKEDRKLIQKAERVLAEIDRGPGLSDEHIDVLAALRIRLEGKERKSLDDLLTAAGDLGKKDLGSALSQAEDKSSPGGDWPEVKKEKKDWPGL